MVLNQQQFLTCSLKKKKKNDASPVLRARGSSNSNAGRVKGKAAKFSNARTVGQSVNGS